MDISIQQERGLHTVLNLTLRVHTKEGKDAEDGEAQIFCPPCIKKLLLDKVEIEAYLTSGCGASSQDTGHDYLAESLPSLRFDALEKYKPANSSAQSHPTFTSQAAEPDLSCISTTSMGFSQTDGSLHLVQTRHSPEACLCNAMSLINRALRQVVFGEDAPKDYGVETSNDATHPGLIEIARPAFCPLYRNVMWFFSRFYFEECS